MHAAPEHKRYHPPHMDTVIILTVVIVAFVVGLGALVMFICMCSSLSVAAMGVVLKATAPATKQEPEPEHVPLISERERADMMARVDRFLIEENARQARARKAGH